MLGVVLTAGGARGAYQAGVLKRLGEIPRLGSRPSPFAIVAGASAGAINGSLLAAGGGSLAEATQELSRLWSNLHVEQVFRTDLGSLARTAAVLLRDLAVGPLVGGAGTRSLLDAAPLRALLTRIFPPLGVARAIRRGHLYAVAVSATSYHSGAPSRSCRAAPATPSGPGAGASSSPSSSRPTTWRHRRRSRSCSRPCASRPGRATYGSATEDCAW